MTQPTSRPGGDFDFDVMEAFRDAYAQQLASPNQDDIANNSGLPTDTVANTSPWYSSVGLWKYPSGKGPDDDLKEAFHPEEYLPEDEYSDDDDVYEDDDDSTLMTDDEIDSLIQELLDDEDE